MISPPQRKYRKKKKKRIHSLKDPTLKKIRYNFRSLLYLWYKEVMESYRKLSFELRNDKSLSYEQRWNKLGKLREEDEELQSALDYSPIGCSWCNNRMKNLMFEPSRQRYFCLTCYERVHKMDNNFP